MSHVVSVTTEVRDAAALRAACQRLGLPQPVADNTGLRQHVAAAMSRVQSALDDLLVERPRRHILRRPQ